MNNINTKDDSKKVFAEKLNYYMNINNKNQDDIVKDLGINKSTISTWCRGVKMPRIDAIKKLANYFKVSPALLMGWEPDELDKKVLEAYPDWFPYENNYLPVKKENRLKSPDITEDVVTFPVIGEIAAGYDEIAVEDWSGDTVDIPTSYLKGRKKEDFFVLSVHGDSMYPMYLNGDKVLILKQNTLDHSGDVGAILYEGECATLKKVEYVQGEDWLRLVPINPEYQPKLIEGADLELCRVIGIPRLLVREID